MAVANLVDCHPAVRIPVMPGHLAHVYCAPWGEGEHNGGGAWHLALEDVRPVWREIEARGLQAVPWTLPDDVEAAVRAYLDGVKVSG